jgi:hypothetical protein
MLCVDLDPLDPDSETILLTKIFFFKFLLFVPAAAFEKCLLVFLEPLTAGD